MNTRSIFARTSWKTTIAGLSGIAVIIGGIVNLYADGDPGTNPEWNAIIVAILSSMGLMFSRDGDKSSEDVGAK